MKFNEGEIAILQRILLNLRDGDPADIEWVIEETAIANEDLFASDPVPEGFYRAYENIFSDVYRKLGVPLDE